MPEPARLERVVGRAAGDHLAGQVAGPVAVRHVPGRVLRLVLHVVEAGRRLEADLADRDLVGLREPQVLEVAQPEARRGRRSRRTGYFCAELGGRDLRLARPCTWPRTRARRAGRDQRGLDRRAQAASRRRFSPVCDGIAGRLAVWKLTSASRGGRLTWRAHAAHEPLDRDLRVAHARLEAACRPRRRSGRARRASAARRRGSPRPPRPPCRRRRRRGARARP